jgi:diaminopimelate epimerase
MQFTKMNSAGNDYVYFDCTQGIPEQLEGDLQNAAIRLSDRHFGIGGDGIVLICRSEVADLKMRMFNNDGSEGKMCGNASICIGKFAYENGLIDRTDFTLETLSGIKTISVKASIFKNVLSTSVGMGKAILTPKEIPVISDKDRFVGETITLPNGIRYTGTAVSMGNPHFVIFSENEIEDEVFQRDGKLIEFHKAFPERVNTEFVKVISDTHLKMRVWERGTGETLACGTGTCASVVAACLAGYCKREEQVYVEVRGGDLYVTYHEDDTVTLTGFGEVNFTGRTRPL